MIYMLPSYAPTFAPPRGVGSDKSGLGTAVPSSQPPQQMIPENQMGHERMQPDRNTDFNSYVRMLMNQYQMQGPAKPGSYPGSLQAIPLNQNELRMINFM